MSNLIERVKQLTPAQQNKISRLVDALGKGAETWINPKSDFATSTFASSFTDDLILNHFSSTQPLTKDKFEYTIVSALNESGHQASKTLSNTFPGQDITVDAERWSLKTQADKNIKRDTIHISKFMELGHGDWNDEHDIERLREGMFEHMTRYERIFTLRCFKPRQGIFEYELVEIPKSLLYKARNQPIFMKPTKQKTAPPASSPVIENGEQLFELYFDGGAERKLQIRKLLKSRCIVHATWRLNLNF